MLPIYSSGIPGVKCSNEKFQDTPIPEAYTRRRIAGSTTCRGYQERGNEITNTVVTIAKWRLQNHPEAAIFLISPWQGNRRGDIHLLQKNVANWQLTTILRSRISIRPARWNSLISFETASLVEKIMFARSWCVRRTLMTVPEP
jgi:hypothetical protein